MNITFYDIAKHIDAEQEVIDALDDFFQSHKDLLEACNLAIATVERLNRHNSANGTLDVLRAAIAKAESI